MNLILHRRNVGDIDTKTGTFTTWRSKTKNGFFRKYGSFGISESVLEHLRDNGIKNIVVNYEGEKDGVVTHHVYRSTLDQWFASKKKFAMTLYDGFYDKQRHLPRLQMKEDGVETLQTPAPEKQKTLEGF